MPVKQGMLPPAQLSQAFSAAGSLVKPNGNRCPAILSVTQSLRTIPYSLFPVWQPVIANSSLFPIPYSLSGSLSLRTIPYSLFPIPCLAACHCERSEAI